MTESDYRNMLRDEVADIRTKLEALSITSHIRSAMCSETLKRISSRIETESIETLDYGYWPPLFVFLTRLTTPQIQSLENDIDLVVKHSAARKQREVTKFLQAEERSDRQWDAGLFEIFAKSLFLKRIGPAAVTFDYELPNGRNIDLRVRINSKVINFECTVITDSDEAKDVWDKFIEAKKIDSNVTLLRPGKFDSPNPKGPSGYYDCLRFYDKVYDKLAKDLNPEKSQLSEDGPNVLLVSFFSYREPLHASSPGVGWALDELLSDQPRHGALRTDPAGIRDISLSAWINFTANRFIKEGKLNSTAFLDDFSEIIRAPRKLGSILLFDYFSLKRARVNYYARLPFGLAHREIAAIEELFAEEPSWCVHKMISSSDQ